MTLQIRDARCGDDVGFVDVQGPGVCASFFYGRNRGCNRQEAEAQARLFVMALEGVSLVDKLKAVQDSLSETIARLEAGQ